jgi:hypothetical protein
MRIAVLILTVVLASSGCGRGDDVAAGGSGATEAIDSSADSARCADGRFAVTPSQRSNVAERRKFNSLGGLFATSQIVAEVTVVEVAAGWSLDSFVERVLSVVVVQPYKGASGGQRIRVSTGESWNRSNCAGYAVNSVPWLQPGDTAILFLEPFKGAPQPFADVLDTMGTAGVFRLGQTVQTGDSHDVNSQFAGVASDLLRAAVRAAAAEDAAGRLQPVICVGAAACAG